MVHFLAGGGFVIRKWIGEHERVAVIDHRSPLGAVDVAAHPSDVFFPAMMNAPAVGGGVGFAIHGFGAEDELHRVEALLGEKEDGVGIVSGGDHHGGDDPPALVVEDELDGANVSSEGQLPGALGAEEGDGVREGGAVLESF